MDIQTREIYRGDHVKAETLFGGKPLNKPIFLKWGLNGHYISIEQAEAMATELVAAAAAARKAVQP